MITLLKMHFYLTWKLFVTMLLFVLAVIGIFIYLLGEFNFGLSSIYLLLFPVLTISIIFENQFIMQLRAMPIQPALFVRSIFVFCLFILLLIMAPMFLYQSYLFTSQQINLYELSFMLGSFSLGVGYIGHIIKNALKEPQKSIGNISIGIFFFYFFTFFCTHLLVVLVCSIFNFGLFGAFIVPVCSLMIYYNFYKKSVVHYSTAEF